MYNPYVSDERWIVGSFRTEEICAALSDLGAEGVVASPFLSCERKIADGFRGIPLPRSPVGCLKKFLRIVREGNYNLIQERPYSRGLFRSGYGAIASIDAGIPLVLEVHNIGTPLSSLKRLPSYLLGLRRCDLVLSYADLQGSRLFAAGSHKVVTVPNGYSHALISAVLSSEESRIDFDGVAKGRKVFGFFGGLSKSKGVDIVLEVARRMAHSSDVCFVFAGPAGELRSEVDRLSHEPGTNVVFLGTLDRHQTIEWMAKCTATFAIHDAWESRIGNPVKVVESIALGTPVIVNDDYRIPDELKSLCTLVNDRSPESVMKTILQLMETEDKIAVPDYIEEFSIESIAERILIPSYRRIIGDAR